MPFLEYERQESASVVELGVKKIHNIQQDFTEFMIVIRNSVSLWYWFFAYQNSAILENEFHESASIVNLNRHECEKHPHEKRASDATDFLKIRFC